MVELLWAMIGLYIGFLCGCKIVMSYVTKKVHKFFEILESRGISVEDYNELSIAEKQKIIDEVLGP